METSPPKKDLPKQRLLRCMDWLQKQNSLEPKKLSQQNKNDIQFIIQTNADRKNFLLSAAEDEATVPAGVDETTVEPAVVPLKRLRVDNLRMECEWQSCRLVLSDYDQFQKHVKGHSVDLHVIQEEDKDEFVCLWDVCGHKTQDFEEMVRHLNYHAYHSHLLAIGFNARATLKLLRCKRNSSKRNILPQLLGDHCCMWTDCDEKYNSIQKLFDHVKIHIRYADKLMCSWGGCGCSFSRRVFLATHVRSHTKEKQIACYHCGAHFANNRKLTDHLRRQNVYPNSPHICTVCGAACATDYLLREHMRQHINAYACARCDMSAPTLAALAQHMRYRHLASEHARTHACPHCKHRAVTKSDLRRHILTHTRKRKRTRNPDSDGSDEEDSEEELPKKKKSTKKYACHMCPKKDMKIFSRGGRLTTHLVKVHGAQWPFGHSRFRYQISEDGMYRLTTTRYEFLDVSRKIVDGYSWPKESSDNSFEFNLKQIAEPTSKTPRQFEISVKNLPGETDKINSANVNDSDSNHSDNDVKQSDNDVKQSDSDAKHIDLDAKQSDNDVKQNDSDNDNRKVEITMCDVDEEGNVIKYEIISSEVISS